MYFPRSIVAADSGGASSSSSSGSLSSPDRPPASSRARGLRHLRLVAPLAAVGAFVGLSAAALSHRRRLGLADPKIRRLRLNHTTVNAICGAMGECAALVTLYPIETLKVRCQTQGMGAMAALRVVLADGPRNAACNLYAGVLPAGLMAMAMGATYLSIFGCVQSLTQKAIDKAERKKVGSAGQHSAGSEWRESSTLSAGIAAASTSLVVACLELPMELVRVRMQAGISHCGFWEHLGGVMQDLGRTGGLLTYLAPCVIKEIPQDCAEFSTYGALTRTWDSVMPAKSDDSPGADWLIAAGAGAAAALISTPADVMKTRLACQPTTALHSGSFGCFQNYACAASIVYQERGALGFFAGLGPRMVKVPSTVVYWVTVEGTRRLLQRVCDIEGEERQSVAAKK